MYMYLFWMSSQGNQYFLLVQKYFRYPVKQWHKNVTRRGKRIKTVAKSNSIVKKNINNHKTTPLNCWNHHLLGTF